MTNNNKMEEQFEQLKKELLELKDNYMQLKNENDLIKEKLCVLTDKKYEIYYQRFLEKKLNATHKKTKYGITDLTTENQHIEIKHWKNYKNALGQLLSYNFDENKELYVYFFGQISECKKNSIVELYKSKNMNIKELIDTPDGIEIKNILIINEHNNKNTIYEWLDLHVIRTDNKILNLKQLSELYYGKLTNNHNKNKLKKEIEKWIKTKHKDISSEYQHSKFNNIQFRGWKGLELKLHN